MLSKLARPDTTNGSSSTNSGSSAKAVKPLAPNRAGFSLGFSGRGSHFTAQDYAAALRGWTYACVSAISQALKKKKYPVYREGKGQDDKIELSREHWAVQLLAKPNPFLVRSIIYKLISEWYDVNGNAYIYTPTYGGSVPREMWVLPSNRMQVVPDPVNFIKGYIYNGPGGQYGIDAREVIHLKNLMPSTTGEESFYVGRSTISAAIDAITVDYYTMKYLRRYFENDAMPAFAILHPGEVDEEQWETLKARWNDTFQGIDNAGKWALIEGGAQIQTFAQTGKQTELQQSDGMNQKRITTVFGVPIGLLTGEHQNRATSETSKAWFHENTVDPRAEYFGEEFSAHFSQFEVGLLVEPKPYSGVDPDFAMKQTDQDVRLGLKTRNEIRKARGEDPVDGGDILLIPSGYVTIDQALNPPTPVAPATLGPSAEDPSTEDPTANDDPEEPPPDEVEGKHLKRLESYRDPFGDESFALEYWKSVDRTMTRGEALIKKGVLSWLSDLRSEVISNIHQRSKAKAAGDLGSTDQFVNLFDPTEWSTRLLDRVTPEIRATVTSAMQQAVEIVGGSWQYYDTQFDDHVRAAVTTSAQKIKTAPEAIFWRLENLLQRNTERHPDELREMILAQFSDVYAKSGAERIARTTATVATTNAQLQAWNGLGIDAVWFSQRDTHVRGSHIGADGQRPDENGLYHVGSDVMLHPGGGSVARENVNCRCVLRPRGTLNKDRLPIIQPPIVGPIAPSPSVRRTSARKPKPQYNDPRPATGAEARARIYKMLEETGSSFDVSVRSMAVVRDRIAQHLKKKRWKELGEETRTLKALMESMDDRFGHLTGKIHEELLFHPAGKAKTKFVYKDDANGRSFAGPHRMVIEQSIEWMQKVLGPDAMKNKTVDVHYWAGRAFYRSLDVGIRINPYRPGYSDTVVHELGHWVDDLQKGVMKETTAFLKRRTRREKLVKLKDLFPSYNYDEDEVTRPDQFISPYIGKEYKTRMGKKILATEVLSVGLEEMYRNPIGFAKADPDMFDFIYDLIRRGFQPKEKTDADNP